MGEKNATLPEAIHSRIAVTRTDHTNRGDLCIVIPGPRMLEIVVIKLIEPKMDETQIGRAHV